MSLYTLISCFKGRSCLLEDACVALSYLINRNSATKYFLHYKEPTQVPLIYLVPAELVRRRSLPYSCYLFQSVLPASVYSTNATVLQCSVVTQSSVFIWLGLTTLFLSHARGPVLSVLYRPFAVISPGSHYFLFAFPPVLALPWRCRVSASKAPGSQRRGKWSLLIWSPNSSMNLRFTVNSRKVGFTFSQEIGN